MTHGKRLFWIGNHFFVHALEAEGWTVCKHLFTPMQTFTWRDIVKIAGWEPDVVVVADKSCPPFVLGMETFPCRTLFYAIDTHIHSYFPLYAQAFDACLISLRDHIDLFRRKRLPDTALHWCPPFAADNIPVRTPEPEWDCLFLGSVNEHTPLRKVFLETLKGLLPSFSVQQGPYRTLFYKARVVLNYCEHGDLNFRVFEALASSACLVTPHVGNGLTDLFADGRELALFDYTQDPVQDAHAAFAVITSLLNPPTSPLPSTLLTADATRTALATNGLARVNAAHRTQHRARAFTDIVNAMPLNASEARCKAASDILSTYLKLLYLHEAEAFMGTPLAQAYQQAAHGAYNVN